MKQRYQFVKWFPEWFGFGLERFNPNCVLYIIYEWCIYLGWWEIRKWVRPQDMERRLETYNTANKKAGQAELPE